VGPSVVEFSEGKQSRIGGDRGRAEFQSQAGIKIEQERG
jgi:hypothetical protein